MYIEGSADSANEIISRGSYKDDRVVKFFEYERSGVIEYWLIDPIRKDATIFALNENGRYERYREDTENRLQSTVLNQFVLISTCYGR